MVKTIKIGDREVKMRASALIPLLYRNKFNRDIYKDLTSLVNDINSENPDIENMQIVERLAYIMAKQADKDETGKPLGNIPDEIEDWLDAFDDVFAIYEASRDILSLWGKSTQSIAESKKKQGQQSGK